MRGLVLSTLAILAIIYILYTLSSPGQTVNDGEANVFLEVYMSDSSEDPTSEDPHHKENAQQNVTDHNSQTPESEMHDYYENERNIMRSQMQSLEKEINFLVLGDFGYVKEPVTQNLSDLIYEKVKKTFVQYDFILSVGDNFYKKGIEKNNDPKAKQLLDKVFRMNDLELDWHGVLGNHDCFGNLPAYFETLKKFPLWKQNEPYYYKVFTIGSSDKKVAFVFLNGCDLACKNKYSSECFRGMKNSINWSGIQTQIDWLKEVLQYLNEDPDIVWKVVVNHWAIFSAGSKHGDNEVMKEVLLPLFTEYKVDLVLSGHDHNLQYLRMNPLETENPFIDHINPDQEQNNSTVEDGEETKPHFWNLDKFLKLAEIEPPVPAQNDKEKEPCPKEVDFTYCSYDEFFHAEMTRCGIVKKDEQQKPLQSLYHDDNKHILDVFETKFARESTSNQHEFLHQFVIGSGGPDLEKVCPLKHLRSLGKLRYSNSVPGIADIKIREDRLEVKLISVEDEVLYDVKIFRTG
jgi:hypothetical protein